MNNTQFIEQIYEIAFGDDAINKGYSQEDVIERLFDYSNDALKYTDLIERLFDHSSDTHKFIVPPSIY